MRPTMRTIVVAAVSSGLILLATARRVSAEEPEATPLFDGKSLDGWTTLDGKPVAAGWHAVDGVLAFDGKGGTIMTAEEFGDFDLRFEWKIAEGGNSGLKYKFKRFGGEWLGCEYQILDDAKHGDGKQGRTSTGSLYHVCEPGEKKKLNPPGEWNSSRVVVRGTKIEHWLNGERILAIDTSSEEWKERIAKSKFRDVEGFGRNELGRIMLQDHGSKVSFRKIEIRTPAGVGE